MSLHTRQAGTWREITPPDFQVKVGGTWQQIQTGYVKVNGTWQTFYDIAGGQQAALGEPMTTTVEPDAGPDPAATKTEIRAWLDAHGYDWRVKDTKQQLLDRIDNADPTDT